MGDENALHELIPLELAARTIYRRVYEEAQRKAGRACGVDQLNGIAYAIISLVPTFAFDPVTQKHRRLSEDEVLKGLLRDGGRSMIFIDGRAGISALAVSSSALDRIASLLQTRAGPP